ncbi:hypothetical protein A1Q2_07357 [Trichosporon asahii var. asahii CBS 8904]|uniref:Uncharacterized protein n=1 Tax=Trichosporon asahii var. asahii (strain CBS 8904) TaxID=1220162 RepID=K1W9L9_TRIAC|nr:hypothetical protein A1Q2_07357 [Trichosporon asahii var. asahii CBS 8904]
MRFLDQLKAKLEPATTESTGGVDAKPQPSGAPAQAAAVPVDHQSASAEPAEPHIDDHKPNPKVAVAVAGAARRHYELRSTDHELTPARRYDRSDAPDPAGLRGLPSRPAMSARPVRSSEAFRPKPASAASVSTSAPASSSAAALDSQVLAELEAQDRADDLVHASSTVPLENSDLIRWREFNNAEEDHLYGPAAVDEEGAPLEPVSPWLGFQALGIATALVGACTALGVWGAAKYLGVGSVQEFADAMKGKLEEGLPELIENVRKDEGPSDAGPNVLGRNGDVDDSKLKQWIEWVEGDKKKV